MPQAISRIIIRIVAFFVFTDSSDRRPRFRVWILYWNVLDDIVFWRVFSAWPRRFINLASPASLVLDFIDELAERSQSASP